METKCTKRAYVDMGEANRMAAQRSHATGDDIRAYKCEDCGWPHLTNDTRHDRRANGRKQRRRR